MADYLNTDRMRDVQATSAALINGAYKSQRCVISADEIFTKLQTNIKAL